MHITFSSQTLLKGPGEMKGNQEGRCVVFLLTLVTGRKMEAHGPSGQPPLKFFFTHTKGPESQASVFRKGTSRADGAFLSLLFSDALSTGLEETGWRTAPTMSKGARGRPCRCQCARCFLFLCLLSFFILLAHLGQNHCISSGGAAIIPTQGLGAKICSDKQVSYVHQSPVLGHRVWFVYHVFKGIISPSSEDRP